MLKKHLGLSGSLQFFKGVLVLVGGSCYLGILRVFIIMVVCVGIGACFHVFCCSRCLAHVGCFYRFPTMTC